MRFHAELNSSHWRILDCQVCQIQLFPHSLAAHLLRALALLTQAGMLQEITIWTLLLWKSSVWCLWWNMTSGISWLVTPFQGTLHEMSIKSKIQIFPCFSGLCFLSVPQGIGRKSFLDKKEAVLPSSLGVRDLLPPSLILKSHFSLSLSLSLCVCVCLSLFTFLYFSSPSFLSSTFPTSLLSLSVVFEAIKLTYLRGRMWSTCSWGTWLVCSPHCGDTRTGQWRSAAPAGRRPAHSASYCCLSENRNDQQ